MKPSEIEANFTPQTPAILVSGAHRTGTTWVGKMLCSSGQAAYISEPLNILHRPGVMRIPTRYWYTYIRPENETDYLPGLLDTINFRYHLGLELRSLRSSKDFLRMVRDGSIFLQGKLRNQRPLLKDPFAVFSAPWFAEKLRCQVVITIRHPLAFASSLKRLDWPFDFSDLLAQPMLMNDHLEQYRQSMEAALIRRDTIEGAALLWRMVYQVVRDFQRNKSPNFRVVRHEDLSLDPVNGFRSLFHDLGLNFTHRAETRILKASSSENPGELRAGKSVHSTRLDSRANLENWKRRLSIEEVQLIRSLTDDLSAHYYPDFTW